MALVVTRTGWTGERGYEVYLTDFGRGVELWDRILEAGRPSASRRPARPTSGASRRASSTRPSRPARRTIRSSSAWTALWTSARRRRSSGARRSPGSRPRRRPQAGGLRLRGTVRRGARGPSPARRGRRRRALDGDIAAFEEFSLARHGRRRRDRLRDLRGVVLRPGAHHRLRHGPAGRTAEGAPPDDRDAGRAAARRGPSRALRRFRQDPDAGRLTAPGPRPMVAAAAPLWRNR